MLSRMSEQDGDERMNIPEYVKSRGYKAEPILNSQAAAEGQPLQVMGYLLRGPRGNKKVVTPDDMFGTELWCDGVDYATKRIEADKVLWARRQASR
jgi:hypothetical protein